MYLHIQRGFPQNKELAFSLWASSQLVRGCDYQLEFDASRKMERYFNKIIKTVSKIYVLQDQFRGITRQWEFE